LVDFRIFATSTDWASLLLAASAAVEVAPTLPVVLVAERSAAVTPAPATPLVTSPRDSIVRFALRQVGTPYVYAGTSPLTGFDCSGFLQYVYAHFGVATPHSTALLIDAGQPVARTEAQPGDIVVFTGTAEDSSTPGHAGIVISALGETPLRFVHASSARRESGVKISQVEGSGYERRFMQVRRVLNGSTSRVAPLARSTRVPTRAVATLPPKPATPVPPLPTKVAPLPLRTRVATHAKKVGSKHAVHAAAKSLSKKKAVAKPARKATTKKKVVAKKPAIGTKSKK
jgi:hypothetical protein